MKKLFLAALAVIALHTTAAAQDAAGNCATIQALVKDLNQNNLKIYKGREIMEGTYESKATLFGYEIFQINYGAFSTDFLAKTSTTTDKAAAAKAYNEAVAQMKTCLKGFTATDNSNEYTQETDFATSKESDAMVLVSLQDINDEYNVIIIIRKNKN